MAMTNTGGAPEGGFDDCRPAAAARYNYNLSRMNKAMLSMFSAGAASPKTFKETETFKTLFAEAANALKVDLDELHRLDYISAEELKTLRQYRVATLSDLFRPSSENISSINLGAIRNRIVNKGR
jgi:isopentenyldiphosphate isomerase